MKISTEIWSAAKIIGEEKAIEYYAKAGFDAWDFSMFEMCRYDRVATCVKPSSHPLSGNEWKAFAKRLARVASDCGIFCNQSHAPFPSKYADVRSYYKRAIECTAIVGGDICVIHPDNDKSAAENAEMYYEILDFAKSCNVRIATENMWNWDSEKDESSFAACATPASFCEHIDIINDPFLVACLDIGHAEMRGSQTSATEMIKALGSRLKALHIHDNNKWKDSHQLPFTMDVDFVPIVDVLREVGYDGVFTLEADQWLSGRTSENIFEGIEEMHSVARRLADMFEAK